MKLQARAVIDGVALGESLALGFWASAGNAILLGLLFIAIMLATVDLYVAYYGFERIPKWADVLLAGMGVATIFTASMLIYTYVAPLPYLNPLLAVSIILESVALLWLGMVELKDTTAALLGRMAAPGALRYVGPVEVRRYVREVREED